MDIYLALGAIVVFCVTLYLLRDRIKSIRLGTQGLTIELDDKTEAAKAQAQAIGVSMADRQSIKQNVVDPSKLWFWQRNRFLGQLPRDLVLNGWTRLKSLLWDAIKGEHPNVDVSDLNPRTVKMLLDKGVVTNEVAQLINLLYDIWKPISDNPELQPSVKQAVDYMALVKGLAVWAAERKKRPPPPPPPPRKTRVGDYFPPPTVTHPAARLIATSGPLRGKRFSVDKDHFLIGASSDNDLVIADDEYLSRHHAFLRYEQGTLYLGDQESKNGTFVNDRRIEHAAATLSPGDRVRVGTSTFQVAV